MRELLELLEHDARRPAGELAAMLHRSEYEVEQQMRQLEQDKIILSYNTLINWEKTGSDTVTSDKIKPEHDRINFLSQFGWDAKEGCVEEVEVKIPADFDRVMNSYNDLQKAQGLDLSEYKGKSAMRYTYEIANYPDYDGTVYANIIVYKNRVIGGDICSSDTQGFIQGFELPSESQ